MVGEGRCVCVCMCVWVGGGYSESPTRHRRNRTSSCTQQFSRHRYLLSTSQPRTPSETSLSIIQPQAVSVFFLLQIPTVCLPQNCTFVQRMIKGSIPKSYTDCTVRSKSRSFCVLLSNNKQSTIHEPKTLPSKQRHFQTNR